MLPSVVERRHGVDSRYRKCPEYEAGMLTTLTVRVLEGEESKYIVVQIERPVTYANRHSLTQS
jgi:hypothetical protein